MPNSLLLFVHGLGGDATSTWKMRGTAGLPDLVKQVPALAAEYAIETWKFPTTILPFPLHVFFSKPRIQILARALKTQIDLFCTKHSVKSVVLVCHSMGGLIARRYLVDEFELRNPIKVRKLLLYDVPNNGAELANLAEFLGWWKHPQISQLCASSDFIDGLNNSWRQFRLSEQICIRYVAATGQTVVKAGSAIPVFGEVDSHTISGNHLSIVKPAGATDPTATLLLEFLDETPTMTPGFILSHGQENWIGLKDAVTQVIPGCQLMTGTLLSQRWHLDRMKVLIMAPPYRQRITDDEADYLRGWVERGGGLFLMGYYAADTHHGGNPSRLAREFDVEFSDDLAMPTGSTPQDCRSQVFSANQSFAATTNGNAAHPLFQNVSDTFFQSGCSLKLGYRGSETNEFSAKSGSMIFTPLGPRGENIWRRRIISEWVGSQPATSPTLLIAMEQAKGRVVVSGTWKLWTLAAGDNRQLIQNILAWLG